MNTRMLDVSVGVSPTAAVPPRPDVDATIRVDLLRLLGFSAFWVAALVVRMFYRQDPRWVLKAALFASFLVPSVLVLLLVRRHLRYRLPWIVEFFAVPFIAAGLAWAGVVIRNVIRAM
jgi:hypothetical protein